MVLLCAMSSTTGQHASLVAGEGVEQEVTSGGQQQQSERPQDQEILDYQNAIRAESSAVPYVGDVVELRELKTGGMHASRAGGDLSSAAKSGHPPHRSCCMHRRVPCFKNPALRCGCVPMCCQQDGAEPQPRSKNTLQPALTRHHPPRKCHRICSGQPGVCGQNRAAVKELLTLAAHAWRW